MDAAGLVNRLTPRNKRLLNLVARGFTNQAIAAEMALSSKTVENYLTDLYAELDIDCYDKLTNPRVMAAVVYLRGSQQDPRALWRDRYRPLGAPLSDAELEGVVGGAGPEDQLLQLIGRAGT